MKIQIASDLHIEYNLNSEFKNDIFPTGDILVLAGDIGSIYNLDQLKYFFNFYSPKFSYIIYVLGNCEFYPTDKEESSQKMDVLKDKVKSIEKNFNNVFILDRSSIQIGDYLFTGCTLWSKLEKSLPMNYRIKDMNSFKYNNLFERDLEFINKKSKYCLERGLKHIVITHYVPIILDISKYKQDLYMSDLGWIMDKYPIHTWIYGHLHQNFNFKYNNTNIITNQKGKPGSFCEDFKTNYYIEI